MTEREAVESLVKAIKRQILAAGGVPHMSIPSRKVLDELKASTINAMMLLADIDKTLPKPAPVEMPKPAPVETKDTRDWQGYRVTDVLYYMQKSVGDKLSLRYKYENGSYLYEDNRTSMDWRPSELNWGAPGHVRRSPNVRWDRLRADGLRRPEEPDYKPIP